MKEAPFTGFPCRLIKRTVNSFQVSSSDSSLEYSAEYEYQKKIIELETEAQLKINDVITAAKVAAATAAAAAAAEMARAEAATNIAINEINAALDKQKTILKMEYKEKKAREIERKRKRERSEENG